MHQQMQRESAAVVPQQRVWLLAFCRSLPCRQRQQRQRQGAWQRRCRLMAAAAAVKAAGQPACTLLLRLQQKCQQLRHQGRQHYARRQRCERRTRRQCWKQARQPLRRW